MSVRQAAGSDLGKVALSAGQGVLLVGAGLLVGAALAAVASKFGEIGPLVLLGLVLVPLVGIATIRDPRVGVIAVFATFPVGSFGVPAAGFDIEVIQLVVLAVAAVVMIGRLAGGRSPLPIPSHVWWFLALIAWTLVGLPSAVDQTLAFKQIAALVLGTLFTCVVVGSCRSLRDVRVLLVGFAVVAVFIGILALLQGGNFESSFGGSRVAGRAVGSFDHSNQLGSLSAMTALFVIAMIAGARSRSAKWAGVIAVMILLGGQALTLSRGAWIGTMVGIVFLAAVLPHARRALVAISVPLFIVGVGIALVAPDSTQVQVIQQRFESLTVRSPYDDRTAIWQEAQREIVDDPITGQGAGGFPAASTKSASGANTVFAYHAHNIALTWAAEAGIPAVLLIIGFAFAIGQSASRARRRLDRDAPEALAYRALVAGLVAALIALLAQGVVDYTLRNAVVFVAVMSLIGCLLAALRIGPEVEDDEETSASAA